MVLLVQNNGDRRIWVIQGIEPDITNHLYITFTDFDMPADMPDGEYTYALIAGNDVEYTLKAEMLESTVNGYLLKDLHPAVGLLRVGILVERNTYEPQAPKNYYYTN